jgi:uncharacterized protein YgiM (DUF1202 family)
MPDRVAGQGSGILGPVVLAAFLAACSAPGNNSSSNLPDVTTVAPTAKTYVATREINLRTGPKQSYARSVVPPGTVVTPNGYVSGRWWQVDTDKYGTGWVDSRELSLNRAVTD